ncbi:chloride channel CLIC-like protein 1 [Girardinichthys multiradiatus]|uniref:chloride channel CLIC-like protein 1 n=1 Tax=Girardinichthys multiradiatus TaxID=208333 RepID=UPI001FACE932|nr:chloride channel CLIC-like protein 1 [Girardinichthys multiradiatus]
MFAFSFFVSIPWNWFYLYKKAYAKHQYKFMKLEKIFPHCMGLKESSLMDSLKDWYRNTFTFQDDPCEEYQKLLSIDPIFEVSPLKVVVYTLEAFFTEPLRAFGDGIGVFYRALLKDLPFILWIPVLIIVTLGIVAVFFGGVQAVFRCFVRGFLPWRGGDLPVNAQAAIQLQDDNVSLEQNVIHQRQPNRTREE